MTRTIAFLVFDRFQILDAAGPISAFEMPALWLRPQPYRLAVVAAKAGWVESSSGAALRADAMETEGRIDTLIVAGGRGARGAMQRQDILAFVRRQATEARRVCSVCSGTYVLAAAGLLDGRRATTHWGRSADFRCRFPDVRLEPDRIFVRDDKFWSSAGVTAGIDLSLALIGEDLGEKAARRVAQELVVYHRRPGGQTQFSALVDIEPGQERFAQLLCWIRERVGERLTVGRLAAECGMSERNFARVFTAATGTTPARAVERLRIEVARERVETGPAPMERIADSVGFGNPERMRRAFLRAFGQPPQGLRRAARRSSGDD